MSKKKNESDVTEQIVRTTANYTKEAEEARYDRMQQNRENFETYHLKQDFSAKREGQSKEFLAKQAMAVEQLASFVRQGLAQVGDDWFSTEMEEGNKNAVIGPSDLKLILSRQLKKAGFYGAIEDVLKLGLLGSLMIMKVDTCLANKPKFALRTKRNKMTRKNEEILVKLNGKVQRLRLTAVSPHNYYPDPTGRGLYEMEAMEVDLHEIRAMTWDKKDGIYDPEVVKQLQADQAPSAEHEVARQRQSGQSNTSSSSSYRKRIQLKECWGSIIDDDGNVTHENVVWTIANDRYLIRPPESNPFWHQESPYVVAGLVRVPGAVWPKAAMDAPTKHNRALNEIYNLSLDNGIMSVYGIKQIRMDYLEDPSQVENGVLPGVTLKVNMACPPKEKVIERVDTANMAPEAIQMFQLTNGEFQQSALTNDLRLGTLPQRKTQATEVVAAEQSITGMLNGMISLIEVTFICEALRKGWMTCAQSVDDFDDQELRKLLGPQKAAQIKSMTKQQRFAETVNGLSFTVYGLTYALNKTKDFRKYGMLMQTLAGAPMLAEEFAKDYSWSSLLGMVLKALDLDPERLKLGDDQKSSTAIGAGAPGGAAGAPGVGGQANMMSQTGQVASEASGGGPAEGTVSSLSQPKYPPSRALQAVRK